MSTDHADEIRLKDIPMGGAVRINNRPHRRTGKDTFTVDVDALAHERDALQAELAAERARVELWEAYYRAHPYLRRVFVDQENSDMPMTDWMQRVQEAEGRLVDAYSGDLPSDDEETTT